ncbi:hypothetical protein GCM10008018_45010 [Paenibacillus marchantiophytorum]|uniref:Uncharacterized protein n=1 Tax=Paenibacillus marchantiophytorum TaxID=1619310 RepID=A0ABQ1EYP4_9BACL|nr:hypothetical protein [Paenibacillus marchantiophytorum]GFZ93564.1 hypothetical protein GCM10008018_45010 [Paenibacillus marchantiophytorum]
MVNLKLRDQIQESVYAEENARISKELDELRQKKAILEKDNDQQSQIQARVNEIIQVM